MIIGYTAGVFDLLHIGHLNLLKNAKGMCNILVVGVTSDELARTNGKLPIIPLKERIELVRSLKYVDVAIVQDSTDKLSVCKKLNASIMFVGDDWYKTEKWVNYEKEFKKSGIPIIYFPYTRAISSTQIKNKITN